MLQNLNNISEDEHDSDKNAGFTAQLINDD